MNLSKNDLESLYNIAIEAAQDAGNYIRLQFDFNQETQHKSAGSSYASQIFTEVDLKSQEIILKHLTPTLSKYDLGLLTEESVDDYSRFEKAYFWCIDPLDGSLPFIEKKDGFAVSIALVSREGNSLLGVVFDPSTNNLYSAIKDQGAFKNNSSWNTNSVIFSGKPLTLICDRSFLNQSQYTQYVNRLKKLASKLNCSGFEIINHGGAVMNAIWTIENAHACYFKLPKTTLGGGSLWDYAATTCIYKELQLPAIQANGKELNLNPPNTTFMNKQGVIFASDRYLATQLQDFYLQHS